MVDPTGIEPATQGDDPCGVTVTPTGPGPPAQVVYINKTPKKIGSFYFVTRKARELRTPHGLTLYYHSYPCSSISTSAIGSGSGVATALCMLAFKESLSAFPALNFGTFTAGT